MPFHRWFADIGASIGFVVFLMGLRRIYLRRRTQNKGTSS